MWLRSAGRIVAADGSWSPEPETTTATEPLTFRPIPPAGGLPHPSGVPHATMVSTTMSAGELTRTAPRPTPIVSWGGTTTSR